MDEAPSKSDYADLQADYNQLARSYIQVDLLHEHLCDVADRLAEENAKLRGKLKDCESLLASPD